MKLVMRGTDIGRISWWLLADNTLLEHVSLPSKPEEYLSKLDHFLTQTKCQLAEITDLIIVNGPGSAAALRASVTLGNTLAWTQGWKISTLTIPAEAEDQLVMERLEEARSVKLANPVYEHAPHITISTHDALKRKM